MGNTGLVRAVNWRRILMVVCIGIAVALAAVVTKQRLRVVELKNRVVELKSEVAAAQKQDVKTDWPYAWRDLGRLDVKSLPPLTPELAKAFDRDTYPAEALTSLDAFHAWAVSGLPAADAWGIPDARMSTAAYFAALAGTLFAYGNRDHPDKPGCTHVNELLVKPVSGCMTEAAFLTSRIGCCTDYAALMKSLLDRSQIPNRMVVGNGHVFNEVTSDPPFIVDANTGILATASWEAIQQRANFTVYQLPLAWASAKSGSEFRPILARFNVVFLKTIATGGYKATYGSNMPWCLTKQ